ncbi:MAG TPA: YfiR family protein [Dongiaceae bacterium]|nr:YfiR family protein [Dongiaceae bacterium]
MLLCGLLLCAGTPTLAADADLELVKEYQVKALFLYNFANFVEWPENAFATPNSPLKMCLYGAVPFGEFLDVVNGAQIRNRSLEVIRTTDYNKIQSGCHILFVGIDHINELESFFRNLNHLFVLSIGNTEDFARMGGVVNILRTQDQQQFEINLSKAMENGLLINSDLLSLARIINER